MNVRTLLLLLLGCVGAAAALDARAQCFHDLIAMTNSSALPTLKDSSSVMRVVEYTDTFTQGGGALPWSGFKFHECEELDGAHMCMLWVYKAGLCVPTSCGHDELWNATLAEFASASVSGLQAAIDAVAIVTMDAALGAGTSDFGLYASAAASYTYNAGRAWATLRPDLSGELMGISGEITAALLAGTTKASTWALFQAQLYGVQAQLAMPLGAGSFLDEQVAVSVLAGTTVDTATFDPHYDTWYCGAGEYHWGAGAYCMAALWAALGLLVVAGTLRPLLPSPQQSSDAEERLLPLNGDAESKAAPAHWLDAFDARRNMAALFANPSRPRGSTAALDGIRAFAMATVVYGHTLLFMDALPPLANPHDVLPRHGWFASWPGQTVPAAEFSVDTFLWLSGLLATRSVLARAALGLPRPWKWVPLAVLQRLLRLLPSLAMGLFTYMYLAPLMGSGALWRASWTDALVQCGRHWWTVLLQVQDVYPWENPAACYGVTWYLQVDFDGFVLAMLLIVLYLRHKRAAYALAGALAAGSIAYAFWLTSDLSLSPGVFDGSSYSRDYYDRPWTRMPAYLLGVLFAFAANDRPPAVSGRGALALAAAAAGIMIVCAFGGITLYSRADPVTLHSHWRLAQKQWYIALSKPAWVTALAMAAYVFIAGRGGLVRRFLAHPFFVPIARLSYGTYLIHSIVLYIYYGGLSVPQEFTMTWFSVTWLGVLCFSQLCAVVLWLCVERPSGVLLRRLFV